MSHNRSYAFPAGTFAVPAAFNPIQPRLWPDVAARAGVDSSPVRPVFQDYFRCSIDIPQFEVTGELSRDAGYFAVDGGPICYGRCSGAEPAGSLSAPIPTLTWGRGVGPGGTGIGLPFDLSDVVENLQQERYSRGTLPYIERPTSAPSSRRAYYLIRPWLPVPIRRHLQRIHLAGWQKIPFPSWPVDCTVDRLMAQTMRFMMESLGVARMPFIWFWPEGAPAAVMMTHDVEGRAGRAFCEELMTIDESFGFRASFQLIPQPRAAANRLAEIVRRRGFEVNVHDWHHDGSLFQDRAEFLRQVSRINEYTRELGASGFRAGAMYRNQSWFNAFEFSYDMSVPNVAHLEPQPGGCCTVMPYFIGNILELPLTTTQDYSLFHILGDYSIGLWKQQVDLILQNHGLVSFIAHPDYLVDRRARNVYAELLEHLALLRGEKGLWSALPGEIDRWWRNRRAMTLVRTHDSWRIEGPDSDKARIAYAVLDGSNLVYEVEA